MNNKPFEWTDELKMELTARLFVEMHKPGYDPDKVFEQFKRERSQPSLSEGIVNAIHELWYDDKARSWNDDMTKLAFETKREWLEARLKQPDVSIYSVKTDEGIFTVKETCTDIYIKDEVSRRITIEAFEIAEGKIWIHYTGKTDSQDYFVGTHADLKFLRKPFKLQCEDGIVTDKKQKVWGAQIHEPNLKYIIECAAENAQGYPAWKFFTTNEAAKSYVSRNEKRYSEADRETFAIKFANWARDNFSNNVSQGTTEPLPYNKWRRDFTDEIFTTEDVCKEFLTKHATTNV